ncbi:ribokinase [Lentibacillus kapialis]|uniref:Ribokinase n=1 Tax=Lentibacillus kapialis TaxID=340214 RepID=A0A917UZA1_9BACI|nr:carbohydrate kinase family protein [Lentibacillus kapialis]GGK02357.1 ribokinase [Lentibacillus kapialis]
MTKKYSVFVGDVALDEYYKVPYWPHESEKLVVETLKPQVGGMIANAASVYAGYGESTFFITLLNDGSITQKLLSNLNDNGIDTSYVFYDNALPDSKTLVFLTENDHSVFIPDLGIEYIDITYEAFELMKGAEIIYTTVTEIKRLRLGNNTALDIIRDIKSGGTKFVCDLDVANIDPGDEQFIKKMDILFFNEVGFNEYRKKDYYKDAVEKLLNCGVETVIITLGNNGANIHTANEDLHIPGIPVDIVDVTGAGDTFCSSFTYAMTKKNNLKNTSIFANAAAAQAVTKMGPRAGVTNCENILEFMKEKGLSFDENKTFSYGN